MQLPKPQRESILASLTDADAEALQYEWKFWGRADQLLPPGNWTFWLLLCGRGWGKTRTGAEAVRDWAASGDYPRIHLVAETAADARDVMVEGDSGILSISPPDFRPKYEPSKRELTWPNGTVGKLFNAREPDVLRGPQCHAAWADELAKWRYPEAWAQLLLGLRLGSDPRCIVTTTPRPTKIIRELADDHRTFLTVGTTFENRGNLAKTFMDQITASYEGTTLGRQELYAEILVDNPGALWSRGILDQSKVHNLPDFARIVVAIDPAISSHEDSDHTGIVVCGLGTDGFGYVIEDLTGSYTPDQWGKVAVGAYHRHKADLVLAEKNQGGEMVEHVIRTVDHTVPYKGVHASRGKRTRAEPIAALWEQGRAYIIGGMAELEAQMCFWNPNDNMRSPNNLDAMVWGMSELMLGDITIRDLSYLPHV